MLATGNPHQLQDVYFQKRTELQVVLGGFILPQLLSLKLGTLGSTKSHQCSRQAAEEMSLYSKAIFPCELAALLQEDPAVMDDF